MTMPGRHKLAQSSDDYRFGFNGMEKDGEAWSGDAGNQLDFGDRIYDSRLGRFLSTDAWEYKYPSHSTYNAFMGNPIVNIDPTGNGAETTVKTDENGDEYAEISSTIYVYTDQEGVDIENFAHTLETSLNAQFNYTGQYSKTDGNGDAITPQVKVQGKGKMDAVFNINVVPLSSVDEAQSKANANTNKANNFFFVDKESTSKENFQSSAKGGNAGFFSYYAHEKCGHMNFFMF